MRTKYIVFQGTSLKRMVIFGESIVHADMAQMCQQLGEPVSAGFVSVSIDEFGRTRADCFGESVSLNLKADHACDSELAAQVLDLMVADD